MKKIFFLTCCLLAAIALQAQDPTTFTLHLKNGSTVAYNVDDIDFFTFDDDAQEEGLPAILEGKVYAIQLPLLAIDDAAPAVYQVMVGNDQVAEICLEYVRQDEVVDKQMLVAYPIGSKGKADLTKGYTLADGGQLVWNTATNTCTYTAGSGQAAFGTIYLDNGVFKTTAGASAIATTVNQYMLEDVRGTETESYPVVKVGTQYWMGENLRTSYLTNGSTIMNFSTTQGEQWKSTTAPAMHIAFDDTEMTLPSWGAMYNGYAILSGALAPEGWAVTMRSDWQKLKDYLGSTPAMKLRSVAEWNDTPGNGNNLSGLNVYPGGIFLPASDGDMYQWSRAAYWTGDKLTDALFGTPGLGSVYVYNSLMLDSNGNPMCHSYEWGQYVRCIRK